MSKYLHARLTSGRDDDLIGWLESLPAGTRSHAIREALRAGLSMTDHASLSLEAIADVVRQAIGEGATGSRIQTPATPNASSSRNLVEDEYGSKLDDLLDGLG